MTINSQTGSSYENPNQSFRVYIALMFAVSPACGEPILEQTYLKKMGLFLVFKVLTQVVSFLLGMKSDG